ncbi:ABC-F family ATP-binding cassette domain-containing protein [Notoacmeibacter sp. MSK16QG-6]|uniref:ABC-F family ATP-binding cassette domain-containing protein n=1 Tax=Notoacmeibacter sp. MSK16QG-6 TaxID=2957982 RepID=UPI00209E659E|nr:ATP-binding cassette domain-containing protein [Notoacmeibacter sp. MSK16QG-6]MCP1200181.1 ATP-binding cassette domain-containing protein [Notoacmeibacter sp. MSK16QG-6]
MAPPLLTLDDIFLTFGGAPLFEGASLSIGQGEKIALIGRNGSGKSTLLKIAAGQTEPMDGEIFRQPGATLRYLPQVPDFEGFETVEAYVEAGLGPADDHWRVLYLIEHLGLKPSAAPTTLSGGEARRAALARLMAPEPDILLLDEPTNHLDLATIEWLEEELARSRSALVTISHDRRFLENVTDKVIWLDRGKTRRLEEGFAKFEDWRDKLLEEEELAHHKLGRKIEREQHWIVHGVSGRRKRNMRRVDELAELRRQYRERRGPQGNATIVASEADASGKLIIEAKGLAKSYGGRPIVRDFSIRVLRGDRIGLVGPNGAGKTTLLKLLIGDLAADEGTLRHGTNLEVATLDQRRAALDPDMGLADWLTGGRGDQLVINDQPRHVISYMKDFLFSPEQARTPIRELSGGEKARLLLARTLAQPANLLVLDEPTNDLDMETLDLLQELVANFAGTVILVSHDRDFLDRTVTSTLVPEGDGRWTNYAGGYSDMLAQRGSRPFRAIGEAAESKSVSRPVPTPPKSETKKKAAKLSYKQQFRLEKLPGEMEALNAEIEKGEAKLAEPDFFSRDPQGFNALAKEIEAAKGKLTAAEEEWLELEMLKEELEG